MHAHEKHPVFRHDLLSFLQNEIKDFASISELRVQHSENRKVRISSSACASAL